MEIKTYTVFFFIIQLRPQNYNQRARSDQNLSKQKAIKQSFYHIFFSKLFLIGPRRYFTYNPARKIPILIVFLTYKGIAILFFSAVQVAVNYQINNN